MLYLYGHQFKSIIDLYIFKLGQLNNICNSNKYLNNLFYIVYDYY